jgi:hypothetical protein
VSKLAEIVGDATEVWADEPGGTVVRTYTEDGITYVDVEFSHSPGKIYTYLKDDNG